MSIESPENENQTLGDILRRARVELGLDLEQVSTDTKIAIKNLRAMEENDFPSLPAEAFTRGFYVLYAKTLALDPEETLNAYTDQRQNQPASDRQPSPPPNKLAQQVGNMAERPTSLPLSFVGAPILILLLFAFFLCWYFSWNPATYLSEKLRSFQSTPLNQQQMSTDQQSEEGNLSIELDSDEDKKQLLENIPPPQQQPMVLLLAPEPAIPEEKGPSASSQPESDIYKYMVSATFSKSTNVTIAIDGNQKKTVSYTKGENAKWQAAEKMVITLPATSDAELILNGIPIDLPKTEKDQITLQIPEDLLDLQ